MINARKRLDGAVIVTALMLGSVACTASPTPDSTLSATISGEIVLVGGPEPAIGTTATPRPIDDIAAGVFYVVAESSDGAVESWPQRIRVPAGSAKQVKLEISVP